MDERQTQILLSLRKITEEVAAQNSLEDAINILVVRIRNVTSADCCSLYLCDPFKKFLRLAATDGLEKTAIGKANLRIGEGLVGYVGAKQELLALADAPSHPNFKYLPDVGEDEFFSFLGVPVINQGQLLGVLVIQSREKRSFDELEESFMVTLSAQIASIIASSNNLRESGDGNIKRCHGESGTGGIAIARAVVWQPTLSLEDVPITYTEDRQLQLELFNQTIFQLQTEMDKATLEMQENHKSIAANGYISGYGKLLDDATFQDDVAEEIMSNGLLATSAIKVVSEKRLKEVNTLGLKEKYYDTRDFAQVLISRLVNVSEQGLKLDSQVILAVKSLPAAFVADLERYNVAGFITVDNATSSHTAILARDLGIPAVIGLHINLNELDGRTIIIDGHNSEVIIDPATSVIDEYKQLISQTQAQADLFSQEKFDSPITLDGKRIKVQLNAGLNNAEDSEDLTNQTDGIGLYRTEIAFMLSQTFPTAAQQTEWYSNLLEKFKDYPVCMRTLDIGGDKGLAYLPIEESNPALGWRGIRLTLDQPNILKTQLHAMLLAQQKWENLEIMIPMVSCIEEITSFKKILEDSILELENITKKKIKRPRLGIMIEVPSIIYVLDDIAPLVDFFSIGSNDLIQYLLAVDRSNQKVGRFFDPFNPSVVRCLKYLSDKAKELNKDISVCGEIAGSPLGALMLLSFGYTCLSMNYSELARVKYICRRVSVLDLIKVGQNAVKLQHSNEIRKLYTDYAFNQGLGRIFDIIKDSKTITENNNTEI